MAVGDTTIPGVSGNIFGGAIFREDARARSSSSVSNRIRGSRERPSETVHYRADVLAKKGARLTDDFAVSLDHDGCFFSGTLM
jgi:hypothetical protein